MKLGQHLLVLIKKKACIVVFIIGEPNLKLYKNNTHLYFIMHINKKNIITIMRQEFTKLWEQLT